MKKLLPLVTALAFGVPLVGCGSSSDSSTETSVKGPPAKTTTAPPGTPGPQERTSAGGGTPDPGGDNGK